MVNPPAERTTPIPAAPSSPMPVIRYRGAFAGELVRHGLKEDVHRRPVAVDPWLAVENGDVSMVHAPDLQVPVARTNQGAPRKKQIA